MGGGTDDSGEWTDDFFLGYFSLHAATELALFSREHVLRLLNLAGREPPPHLADFVSVHSWVADPLIAEARKRLAEAAMLRDVDYVHDL